MWYLEANETIRELAAMYNMEVERIAGICAILSPMNKWNNNLLDLDRMLARMHRGMEYNKRDYFAFGQNSLKAWKLANCEISLERAVTGPKVTSFYHNILLDSDYVTVDGHAYNIWANQHTNLNKVPSFNYAKVEADYREVASELGLPAYQLQAITWLVWREHYLTEFQRGIKNSFENENTIFEAHDNMAEIFA